MVVSDTSKRSLGRFPAHCAQRSGHRVFLLPFDFSGLRIEFKASFEYPLSKQFFMSANVKKRVSGESYLMYVDGKCFQSLSLAQFLKAFARYGQLEGIVFVSAGNRGEK